MQTYCYEATKSFENKLMGEEIIPSPVPIQNLVSYVVLRPGSVYLSILTACFLY